MRIEDEAEQSSGAAEPLRLRERRRRDLRGEITNAATRMFLERGFEAVRVSDVARACGVTEKTVYNHFPTKESLLVDRWSPLIRDTERALLSSRGSPVNAVVDVLLGELDDLLTVPALSGGSPLTELARFTELTRSTPALVAHEQGELEHLSAAIAATLMVREAPDPVLPSPSAWITATALAGLFAVLYRSLHRHVHAELDDERVEGGAADADDRAVRLRQAVVRDLHEATDVLRRGI